MLRHYQTHSRSQNGEYSDSTESSELTDTSLSKTCEYLVDNRLCMSVTELPEGMEVREETCKKSPKNYCCYLCSKREKCEISCSYLDSPRKSSPVKKKPKTPDEPTNNDLTTIAPNDKEYHSTEKTMSREDDKVLSAAIQLVKLSRNTAKPSLLDAFQGSFDPLSSMNWQMINKKNSEAWGKQGLEFLAMLFDKYPFQVVQALNRERLISSLEPFATNCPNCVSLIPKSKVNFALSARVIDPKKQAIQNRWQY